MNHKRVLELVQAIRNANNPHMLSCYHWRLTGYIEASDMTWDERYQAVILADNAYCRRYDELIFERYGKAA